MNVFLLAAYLFDKRPQDKPVDHWLNISVLVPAYNEEINIKSTIESILKQNYLGLIKIIVIDNGSKDRTLEILQSIQADNLVILEEKKKGKAHVNEGVKARINGAGS